MTILEHTIHHDYKPNIIKLIMLEPWLDFELAKHRWAIDASILNALEKMDSIVTELDSINTPSFRCVSIMC